MNRGLFFAIGVVLLMPVLFVVEQASASPVVLMNPWSAAGGNKERNHFDAEAGPVQPKLSWVFDRTDTNGVIDGMSVYVIGYDRAWPNWIVSNMSQVGRSIYKLSLSTGEVQWQRLLYPAGEDILDHDQMGSNQIFSQPTVTSNRVVFWDQLGTVWALDASNGNILWTSRPGEEIFTHHERVSPLVVGDKVVFLIDTAPAYGIQSMRLMALDLATGATQWSVSVSQYADLNLASDGTRILGVYGDSLYAWSAADGSALWNVNLASYFGIPFTNAQLSAPAIANGNAYVHVEPISAADAPEGGVIAVRLSDGLTLFSKSLGQDYPACCLESTYVAHAPAVDSSRLIVAKRGVVHGLNPTTGSMIWGHDVGGPIAGDPVLTSDQVVVARSKTWAAQSQPLGEGVFGLSRADGSSLWEFGVNEFRLHMPMSLAAGNGKVVAAFDYQGKWWQSGDAPNRGLFAIGLDQTPPAWSTFYPLGYEIVDGGPVTLTWARIREFNPARFELERATNANGPWQMFETVAYTGPQPIDETGHYPGLYYRMPGTTSAYYYRVRPFDQGGLAGPYSNVAGPIGGGNTAPPPPTPPATTTPPASQPTAYPTQEPTYATPPPRRMAMTSILISPVHSLVFDLEHCVYLETQDDDLGGHAPTAPGPYDLRLVPCAGNAPFTFASQNGGSETGYGGEGNTAPFVYLSYFDDDADNRWDQWEPLYLTTAPPPGLPPSGGPDQFSIRLNGMGSYAAGSFVRAVDADVNMAVNGLDGSVTWTDDDADGALSAGDGVWLLPLNSPGFPAGNELPTPAIALRQGMPPRSPTISPPPPMVSTAPCCGAPTTRPSPTAPPGFFQIVPGSLAFDSARADSGDIVGVMVRVVNPESVNRTGVVSFDARTDDGLIRFTASQAVDVGPGEEMIVETNWIPDLSGHYFVRAHLGSQPADPDYNDPTATQASSDEASFWVGGTPGGVPVLLLTSGLVNVGTIEEGSARTIPVEVTAYNTDNHNVVLEVYDDDGLIVQSLTPTTTLHAGQTIRFFLQVRVPDLGDNESLGARRILIRAVSSETASSVEPIDLVVHTRSFVGAPFPGATFTVAAAAAAGGSAAFFRRRERGGTL